MSEPSYSRSEPSKVEITLLAPRGGRGARKWILRPGLSPRRMAALALALIAVVGAVLASALSGERTRGAGARAQGAAGVAAVYGYPPRCLIVTISTADRTYARADFNRATPCGRFDGYATAIFHRVDGSWRPVLDAVAYSCPVASVPSPVRAELGVCP